MTQDLLAFTFGRQFSVCSGPGRLSVAAPDALVVVARLIPVTFSDAAVVTYNNALGAIVETRASAGEHVVLVDMHTGFPASELPDGVHPNAAGFARMANVWYTAIGDLLR